MGPDIPPGRLRRKKGLGEGLSCLLGSARVSATTQATRLCRNLMQLRGLWAQTCDFHSTVHPMPTAPRPAPPPAALPPAPRAHLSALSGHSCRQLVTPYLFQHLLKNLFSELK